MRVDDAMALFADAENAANYYFGATLQVNMQHVLKKLPPESQVPADFLNGLDAIASTSTFRLARGNILAGVIGDLSKGEAKHAELIDRLKAFGREYATQAAWVAAFAK